MVPQESLSQDELLRQLSFIEDPAKQLQELIKHGLISLAERRLRELVSTSTRLYFQSSMRVYGAVHIGKGNSKSEYVVCMGNQLTGRTDYPALCFDPGGLKRLFGWTKAQTQEFMMTVFERVMDVVDPTMLGEAIASWAGSHEVYAFYKAKREWVTKNDKLHCRVEVWHLRALFFTGGYFLVKMMKDWRNDTLGKKIEPNKYRYDHWLATHGSMCTTQEIVEAFIERMRTLGHTDEQIRDDCRLWLDQYAAQLSPVFVASVANASVFEWGDERRAATLARIAPRVTEGLLKGNVNFGPFVVSGLIEAGMLRSAGDEIVEIYRAQVAERLAEGRIGLVTEVTTMVAVHYFGMDEKWSSNPKLKFSLEECAAKAFDLAWQRGEYGIAAALVNQFGEDACFDKKILRDRAAELMKQEGDGQTKKQKLDELVAERKAQIINAADLAKTTGKPIRLDYSLEHAPKL